MKSYFTQPPMPKTKLDIPAFLKRFYPNREYVIDLQYIIALYRWADKEFEDVKAWCILNKNKDMFFKLSRKDCHWLLAVTDEFQIIRNSMTQELWNSLPKAIQRSLAKTESIYKGV